MYRQDCFNGIVEYQIYDSNSVLICRAELPKGYASPLLEERMSTWLDIVDPVEPKESAAITAAASLLVSSLLLSGVQQVVA